ncbi:MAG: HAD family phosphatase [Acidimicrobiia bacterium]|nr:HAD family phosphatase [Acidimicrobiia bacterium]
MGPASGGDSPHPAFLHGDRHESHFSVGVGQVAGESGCGPPGPGREERSGPEDAPAKDPRQTAVQASPRVGVRIPDCLHLQLAALPVGRGLLICDPSRRGTRSSTAFHGASSPTSRNVTRIRAVLFDLGGVIFESPLHTIASFEAERGLAAGTVGRFVTEAGGEGAWARHERGEISTEAFERGLRDEARRFGVDLDVAGMMRRIEADVAIRPRMLAAVGRLRDEGFSVAAVTNNWKGLNAPSVAGHFDVVVESYLEGVRKPEPAIYRITLARLGVAPRQAVMLDDIGVNLKTALKMGMTTIKVTDPLDALEELGALVGVRLL